MSRQRVTSRDVAKRAGVSRTTVSFVLNNVQGMNISAETRQRVLEAAKELDYVPYAAARTLASGRTRTIGLVISHAQHIQVDVYISQVLYILNEVCHQHGFRLLIEALEDVSRPDAYVELVGARQIDGLVVLNPRLDDSQLPQLMEQGYPLVVMGDHPHPTACYVNVDQVRSTESGVAHLIGLGHRRIAFINFAPLHYLAAAGRLSGYQAALESAGLAFDERLARVGNYSPASGYATMASLLENDPLPTALMAGNDTIAFGAIAAIHEAGLRIPDDIAIVGYDDIPKARYAVPPLTTMRLPALEQARRCGEMVIQLVSGKAPVERQVTLEAELVIRHSCGAKPLAEPLSREVLDG
jgi:DNA-binding LacI/PurR family transcriptional regulator